jgi:hypothetical protein
MRGTARHHAAAAALCSLPALAPGSSDSITEVMVQLGESEPLKQTRLQGEHLRS